jgi:hypothetical protein
MRWDNIENTLGTTKFQHSTLSLKEKEPRPPWVDVTSPHWLQEYFLPTYVLCHFWVYIGTSIKIGT